MHGHKIQCTNTHTTHNHFAALQILSGTTQVSWYQKVHFAIFWIFLRKMKTTQADTPTNRMDCHPIQTNWCPISAIPTIFMPDVLSGTTLPIYPALGQAPNMLACIPRWLGCNVLTHTHNRFTAGLEYVRVHPGQQVPER